MYLLKPAFRVLSGLSLAIDLSEQPLKLRLRRDRLQSLPRHCLQHNPRIVSLLPEFRVDALPESICRMVEGPSKVQSQVGENVRNSWIRRTSALDGTAHS